MKEESEPSKEIELEVDKLPYLKEDKKALPKDYEDTLDRLTAKLEQSESATKEQSALIFVAVVVALVFGFTKLTEMSGYPDWMVAIMKVLTFVEACIPFAVSFFLKNPKYATILRGVGIIILILYLYTLFWSGFFGGL